MHNADDAPGEENQVQPFRPEGVHPDVPEAALQGLPADLKELVVRGQRTLWPGRDPLKPVIRYGPEHKRRGALAPLGTAGGVGPNHKDVGNGRRGGVKQTKEYQALLERAIPASDDPEEWGGFAWLIEQGLEAAEGGDKTVPATCPECSHKFPVIAYKKHDTNAIIKLIEFVRGRATETKQVDVRSVELHAILAEGTDIANVQVHALEPAVVAARRQALENQRLRQEAGGLDVELELGDTESDPT
jgi:hypothetical protein